MKLGDKIRIAREKAGLTQEELGKRCGTTKQTIYKYEIGKVTNIPLDRLEMIAEAVGVSSSTLLGWDNGKDKPTVSDGLSDVKRDLIQFAEGLTNEQAALALRVLKSIVEGE
jgi:transcriptional regulator with XRE-family HTH domain